MEGGSEASGPDSCSTTGRGGLWVLPVSISPVRAVPPRPLGAWGWAPCPHVWAVFQVEPFASLSEAVGSSVPRLLINRDLVGPLAWRPRRRDVVELGDVVCSVEKLVELLGWTEEIQGLMRREEGKVKRPSGGLPPHRCGVWTPCQTIWLEQ